MGLPFRFLFFETHAAGSAWPVGAVAEGGIRVFGRALAQGVQGGNGDTWIR